MNELRDIAEEWKSNIDVGFLDKYDAWVALTTMIMKTIEYPLPALTFTQQECRKIMAPILEAGLKNSGICRNMARSLVYAPKCFQGLLLKDPYLKQGLDKIHMWFQNSGTKNLTDSLLKHTYEAMQLEVGTTESFLLLDYSRFKKAITPTWISNLWEFLSIHQIQTYEEWPMLKMMRDDNKCIMDLLYLDKEVTLYQLAACNRCRLYLQVVTMSEILNGDGRTLRKCFFQGWNDQKVMNLYKWPYQGKPSRYDFNIWKICLSRILQVQSNGTTNVQLGNWKEWTQDLLWTWHYSPSRQEIYEYRSHNRWKTYFTTNSVTRNTSGLYLLSSNPRAEIVALLLTILN